MSETEKSLCEGGWCYVRPLPGHAIVNLGDALVKFSKGGVRSSVHRVVKPPGRQGGGEVEFGGFLSAWGWGFNGVVGWGGGYGEGVDS